MDRAGLCGPDGPTHHGVFDNSYMRIFPNMVVTAPADEQEIRPMLEFALQSSSPVSIRYPKTRIDNVPRNRTPIVLGQSETLSEGEDGTIIACGTMLAQAVEAAAQLREQGVSVGVVNARFVKPIDEQMVARAAGLGFVITVEENALMGGFGSAVLESASRMGLNTERFRVLAIPDHFVEHGEREELLAEMQLDAAGLVRTALTLLRNTAATAG
jgi:1-deoxy-D-xylulose-5-phosphate synthase